TLLPRPPRPTLFPYTTLFRSVTIRMHSIRRDRIPLTATARRSRISGGIPCHVSKRKTGVRGADKCAPVVSAAVRRVAKGATQIRSEEHTSELQSLRHLVCRLL